LLLPHAVFSKFHYVLSFFFFGRIPSSPPIDYPPFLPLPNGLIFSSTPFALSRSWLFFHSNTTYHKLPQVLSDPNSSSFEKTHSLKNGPPPSSFLTHKHFPLKRIVPASPAFQVFFFSFPLSCFLTDVGSLHPLFSLLPTFVPSSISTPFFSVLLYGFSSYLAIHLHPLSVDYCFLLLPGSFAFFFLNKAFGATITQFSEHVHG